MPLFIHMLAIAIVIQCTALVVASTVTYWPVLQLFPDWPAMRVVAGLIYDGVWSKLDTFMWNGRFIK